MATDESVATPNNGRQARHERYRRDYLKHESAARNSGIFYLALAVDMFGYAVLKFQQEEVALSDFGLGAISFLTGCGLLKLNPTARTGAGIVSFCVIAANWSAALLQCYFLFLLFSEKGAFVFSPSYQLAIRKTRTVKWRVAVIPVVISAFLVLSAGYHFYEITLDLQKQP